jgi:hypothetical protein
MARPAEPGERLTDKCGPHCGIIQSGEVTLVGHCSCGTSGQHHITPASPKISTR